MNRIIQLIEDLKLTLVKIRREQSERVICSKYRIQVSSGAGFRESFLLTVIIPAVLPAAFDPNVFRSMRLTEGEEPRLPKDLDDKIAELIAAAIYEAIRKMDTNIPVKDKNLKENKQ